ncbi:MAG: hypothetical protein ACK5ZD_10685 [Hyphomonadaceae bacterium]
MESKEEQEAQTYFGWQAALIGARSVWPGKRASAAAGRIGL